MSTLPKEGGRLGRFLIRSRLGKGGMGIVYLAHDTMLNTDVVLKLLLPSMTEGGDIERFRRELLVARRISHPGVCRLYDIHQEEDFHFISMEYIQGRTIEELVRDEAPMPAQRAIRLMQAACDGVAAAHRLDIIHRDLKPSNIIATGEDRVSILDFGLSKALDLASITVTNVRVGTMQYMSPEVMQNQEAGKQSDVYSLGVVLYECVTKHLPYRGYDMVAVGRAAAQGKWVPPRLINPDVPPSLERVLSRALEPDLSKRFASVEEFKSALDKVLTEIAPAEPEREQREQPDRQNEIEDSVQEVFGSPTYSEVLRARVKNTTILFSDIVAITEYFDRRGDVAGTKRIQAHCDLLFPVIGRYRGQVIKTVGDAIMACFDTAEDGVGAAIGMQRALESHNDSIGSIDEKISIRIGINSGQSIFESRDVFGDVVNVAARICAEARGDQILISAATREMLHPERHPATFHSKVSLKGKSIPQKLYAIAWGPPLLGEEESTRTGTSRPEIAKKARVPRLDRRRILALAGAASLILAIVVWVSLSSGGGDRDAALAEISPALRPAPSRELKPTEEMQPEEPEPEPELTDAEPEPTEPGPAQPAKITEQQALDTHQQNYRALRNSLRVGMRKKGIITGDSPGLDRERRRMKSYWKSSRYQEALKAAQRARKILAGIQVDRTLVKSKLLRFNRLFDRVEDQNKKKTLTPLARKIMEAYDSEKYQEANRLLNEAIRLMRTT